MTEVLQPIPPSCESGRTTERAAGGMACRSPDTSNPRSPPLPPPILRRNTTAEIEIQLDEPQLSCTYEKHLLDDNEIFASQTNLKLQHHYYLHPPDSGTGDALHMKEIMKEFRKTLPSQLEVNCRGSMFVRFDEESPQYLRAMLTGIDGTPYASGVFLFDIFLPADYPHEPCLCTHVTPNANLVHANNGPGGFSPNLHSDTGQVCLSLLGTWDGPGWESGSSNVYQVLSTILYMILGAKHPYYMEPDYGGWEGTAPTEPLALQQDPDREQVLEYDREVQLFTAKLCVLAPLLTPPTGFEGLTHTHLFEKRKLILATLRRWVKKASDEDSSFSDSDFATKLTAVIVQIEQAYKDRMTRRYAEEDCRECQQVISFIEEKMRFLMEKIRFSSSSSSCTCASLTAPEHHTDTDTGTGTDRRHEEKSDHSDSDSDRDSSDNLTDSTPSYLSYPPPCDTCCAAAKTGLPKAYARYQLGPRLLARARQDLHQAQVARDQAPLHCTQYYATAGESTEDTTGDTTEDSTEEDV